MVDARKLAWILRSILSFDRITSAPPPSLPLSHGWSTPVLVNALAG